VVGERERERVGVFSFHFFLVLFQSNIFCTRYLFISFLSVCLDPDFFSLHA
jgi:hypothetical protein